MATRLFWTSTRVGMLRVDLASGLSVKTIAVEQSLTPAAIRFGINKYIKAGAAPEKDSHGMTGTKIYILWWGMKSRCEHPKTSGYEYYGGRGITVCERWQHFENFLADMGERPSGMTLDRVDVTGNYEPSNCRWASAKQQHENKRNAKFINWEGQKYMLSYLCRKLGILAPNVYREAAKGISLDLAVAKIVNLRRIRNAKIIA